MLRNAIVLVAAMGAQAAVAQNVEGPSPLPIFDTESGVPFVAESIISPDTLQNIEAVAGTHFYEKAAIAARVEDLSGDGFCTGFRIGETLFMTNYHCWEVAQCDVLFHMGYETDLPADQQAKFKCVEVLDKFEQYDFALYRVERVEGTEGVDFPIGALSKRELVLDMPLLVPGHPAARPKQIDTSDQCKLTLAVPYRFYDRDNIMHQCDTLGGSSGSPVIDRETGHIIGIHWGGSGTTGSNHAIPMSLIIERLSAQLPDVFAELSVVEN